MGFWVGNQRLRSAVAPRRDPYSSLTSPVFKFCFFLEGCALVYPRPGVGLAAKGERVSGCREKNNMKKGETLLDAGLIAQLEHLELVVRRLFIGRTQGEKRSRRRGTGSEFAD